MPDFIPVLGYLDDVILLPLLIAATVKLIPSSVLDRCRKQAEDMWEGGKPKRWVCAIPIILVWLMLFALILLAIL